MDPDYYEPEREEEKLRTRLMFFGSGVIALMFLWFAVLEFSAGQNDRLLVSVVGVIVCTVNILVARYTGPSLLLARWSVAYMLVAALYYASMNFSTTSLLFCLVLPIISSILLGYREAILWNLTFGVCFLLMIVGAVPLGTPSIEPYPIDFLASYLFIVVVASGYERMRALGQERTREENRRLLLVIEKKNEIAARNDRLFEDLNDALKEVRELTGLIPICASCKKVRGDGGDEGFWEHVEAYLHKRTRLTFSHSICPGCSDEAIEALDVSAAARV